MNLPQEFRKQLQVFNEYDQAHMGIDEMVKDFPLKDINTKPPNVPYTFWHLLEHMRRSIEDNVEFCEGPDYKEKDWPKDYWPAQNAKTDKAGWKRTIKQLKTAQKKLLKMIANQKADFFTPFEWGEGQTLYREAILVVDHLSYHIGEFAILRQVLDNWSKKHGE